MKSANAAPRFRKRQFPKVGGQKLAPHPKSKNKEHYDHKWDELSNRFRAANPFCRFCVQQGFETPLADSVDHIIPIEDGGDRLNWGNLQSLCNKHHYGLKAKLENRARKLGDIQLLVVWCSDPEMRPDLTQRLGHG